MAAALDRLRAAGWRAGRPLDPTRIEMAELELGLRLPEEYRDFLLAEGVDPPAPTWRGLWCVDQLISLNRHFPVFRWFGGLVGIGNEGFLVLALDFRRPDLTPVVSLGLSSSDWRDVDREGASFVEWLESTLA